RFRFLSGRRLTLVAAAVVVVVGGVWAIRGFGSGLERSPFLYERFGGASAETADVKVASAPAAPQPQALLDRVSAQDGADEARKKDSMDGLQKLGYGGDDGAPAAAPSAATPTLHALVTEADEGLVIARESIPLPEDNGG